MTLIRAVDGPAAGPVVRPDDVVETVFRGSGKGGQAVNKTSSAVRMIHAPTGIIVTASDSRSQWENRQIAWERLNTALAARAAAEHARAASSQRVAQFGGERQWLWCAWRDQVTNPAGKTMSMKAALRGGLTRLN